MNFVFWFIILIIFICIWFTMAPSFREFGEIIISLLEDTKEEIKNDESEDN